MRRKAVRRLFALGGAMLLLGIFCGYSQRNWNLSEIHRPSVGCFGKADQTVREGSLGSVDQTVRGGSGKEADLSGSLRLAGSSSMERMISTLAEGFMEEYPNVVVTIEYIGSAAGIGAVLNGSVDIGTSSRNLKEEETEKGAVAHLVALDGIAVCVDPTNTVTRLTEQQVVDIYTGRITNWSELGGEDLPIVVIGHEAGSGTRTAFEELLGIEDRCLYANELNSMGAVMARVALVPGAIGYLSCEVADETVQILSLNGVEPTAETIENGTYPLCRPFLMVTRGEISAQKELVQVWFDYVFQDHKDWYIK